MSLPPIDPKAKDWNSRLLLACSEDTLFGQIIRAAMRTSGTRIGTVCNVTSDGFCMADYTDLSGARHMGALICNIDDLEKNMSGVCKHLNFTLAEREAFLRLMLGWIGEDYRAVDRNTLRIV